VHESYICSRVSPPWPGVAPGFRQAGWGQYADERELQRFAAPDVETVSRGPHSIEILFPTSERPNTVIEFSALGYALGLLGADE